jgi:redox-sensing transcriptional repressor
VIGTFLAEDAGQVMHIDALPKIVKEREIEILILTVPAQAIKEVYDLVMLSGVKAVLNFAPFKLISSEDVVVHNVDLTTELESLSYHLRLKEAGEPVLPSEIDE